MKLSNILKISVLCFSVSCATKTPTPLPYFGPKHLSTNGDTIYHKIGSFSLQNQYGQAVENTLLQSKLSVVNFFFATCQTICPIMSKHLMHLQDSCLQFDAKHHSKNYIPLQFISITVNPAHDTPEVLINYAKSYNAKPGFWSFLTGTKTEIYRLAKEDFLVNALENNAINPGSAYISTNEDFIHSELLMLIDTQGCIRGLYNGTDEASVWELWQAIKLLQQKQIK